MVASTPPPHLGTIHREGHEVAVVVHSLGQSPRPPLAQRQGWLARRK